MSFECFQVLRLYSCCVVVLYILFDSTTFNSLITTCFFTDVEGTWYFAYLCTIFLTSSVLHCTYTCIILLITSLATHTVKANTPNLRKIYFCTVSAQLHMTRCW